MNRIISSRLLNNDTRFLSDYCYLFEKLSGNPVEMIYLEQAMVRGFFKKNELVAGYALNKNPPFRSFLFIPESERSSVISNYIPGGESVCCELSCLWKDRQRVSLWETNWIYIFAIYDSVLSGKRNIVGGSFVDKYAKDQTRILKNIVYAGRSDFKENSYCSVYFTTRTDAIRSLFRELGLELHKSIARIWFRLLDKRYK